MNDRIVSYSGNEFGLRDQHNQTLLFLEMLDSHCKQHSITYSLAFGSMLGCVRSHGFIPWDDDVDIVMKRADYNRFFESIKKHDTELSKKCDIYCPLYLNKLRYTVNDEGKQPITMYMDLFAADVVPQNFFLKKSKYYAILFLKNVITARKGRLGKKYRLLRFIRKIIVYIISFPFSVERLKGLYSRITLWGESNPSDKFTCYYSSHRSYGKYHKVELFNKVKYMPFEDIELPVLEGYDEYLTTEFGDYMKLPPEKERHAFHTAGWE